MFLKAALSLLLVFFALSATAQVEAEVADQHDWSDDITGSHVSLVGTEAWAIDSSETTDNDANMNGLSRLQLANSYPVQTYQNVAAWMRFEGGLRFSASTLLNMRLQLHQVHGNRLDEAAIDHGVGVFGIRFGVLDPRISWCRTYDTDSPWVRENNPFCTIKPLNFARSSAPGLQLYAHHIVGDYSLQGLLGSYYPLAFSFADDESPTVVRADDRRPVYHRKTGGALSASNLKNGTEIRLGFMRGRYEDERIIGTPQVRSVDSTVLFLGLSWYINEFWAVRTTQFGYNGEFRATETTPPSLRRSDTRLYRASTYEVNYQATTRDVLAASISTYHFDLNGFFLGAQPSFSVRTMSGYPRFDTHNLSLAWRRDWGKSLFTTVQVSRAVYKGSETLDGVTRQRSSNGNAIGLRLGYRL